MRVLRSSALAGLLLLAGCQSQWFHQFEKKEMVTTDVVIRSEPSGADIRFDGVGLGPAPLRMPVEHVHVEQLWTRQTNKGAELSERWGTVGTILGFPVILVASLFHETEDRRRHLYSSNEFDLVATLPQHRPAEHHLVLEGQDELEVVLTLDPR